MREFRDTTIYQFVRNEQRTCNFGDKHFFTIYTSREVSFIKIVGTIRLNGWAGPYVSNLATYMDSLGRAYEAYENADGGLTFKCLNTAPGETQIWFDDRPGGPHLEIINDGDRADTLPLIWW